MCCGRFQTAPEPDVQKYLIVCNDFFSCSRPCGSALDARNSSTEMMLIFSIVTLEYPGERIYNPCDSKLDFHADPTNNLQVDDKGELLFFVFPREKYFQMHIY
jgi:hypothetical protein